MSFKTLLGQAQWKLFSSIWSILPMFVSISLFCCLTAKSGYNKIISSAMCRRSLQRRLFIQGVFCYFKSPLNLLFSEFCCFFVILQILTHQSLQRLLSHQRFKWRFFWKHRLSHKEFLNMFNESAYNRVLIPVRVLNQHQLFALRDVCTWSLCIDE